MKRPWLLLALIYNHERNHTQTIRTGFRRMTEYHRLGIPLSIYQAATMAGASRWCCVEIFGYVELAIAI